MDKIGSFIGSIRAKACVLAVLCGKPLLMSVASLVLCSGIFLSHASAQISTADNNFTMIDGTGGLAGGTNDVTFTWAGTQKISVATSGQVSNATISSSCSFFGNTWSAHDVAIYGPGTYTIYDGCASGAPGCGTGNVVNFTVVPGQLAAHMLFDWGINFNIDVVDVWQNNAVFGPSAMWTGTCGSNPASKVWNLMTIDSNGDGFNGQGMTDGGFIGFNADFNLMATPCTTVCYDGNACTDDVCNVGTGACEHPANTSTALCNTNVCMTGQACNGAGTCAGGSANTAPCDDTLVCTENDVCSGGSCAGTAVVCPSPVGTCDPISGCCFLDPRACNDNNPCTDEVMSCNTGTCAYINNTAPCNDSSACTIGDVCSAGTCGGTATNCDDGDICTADTCDSATGCVHTLISGCGGETCIGSEYENLPVDTLGNNFTMIDGTGSLVGGTNDVRFTWDGTKKTAVAASGQIPNATISSSCPFFGQTWNAHDVTIYAPGTYTIYDGCVANSPGCGTGNAVSFTVAEGELGAHMLFNWGTSANIDVIDVWAPTLAFGPSPMWTGNCGAGGPTKVWDWMSKDFDGDGKNGKGMTDGPFIDFNANFNVMGGPLCAPSSPIILVFPENSAQDMDTTIEFRWMKHAIINGNPNTYSLSYCTAQDFSGCTPVTVTQTRHIKNTDNGVFYAGGAGLFLIGVTFFSGRKGRRWSLILIVFVLCASTMGCPPCSDCEPQCPDNQICYTVNDLNPGTVYYWKVTASDGTGGGTAISEIRSFTTR